MWVWAVRCSKRARWIVLSAWCGLWLPGYSALQLIRYGYGSHQWAWWLLWAAASAGLCLLIGWFSVVNGRQVLATQREAIAGLDQQQRRQLARVWRRGPVPEDPAVLAAALRFHDLSEQYRRRSLRRRKVAAAIALLYVPILIWAYLAHQVTVAGVLMVAYWAIFGFFSLWPDLRAKLRRPRLTELHAAAQQDPSVSVAVADRITAAPRPKMRRWMVAVIVVVAVAYAGTVVVAIEFSPKKRGCRAADSVIDRLYTERDWFWTNNIGGGGRPLEDYQQLAKRLRRYASDVGDYTAVAPHMNRIADLVDQEVVLVGQARQPAAAPGQDDPLADAQTAYVHLLKTIADEETQLQQACR